MESLIRQILQDQDPEAAWLDAGPHICEPCTADDLETIAAQIFDMENGKVPEETPRKGIDKPWAWGLASVFFHVLVILSVAHGSLFSVEQAPPPPEIIAEVNLGELAGPGGSGGDGRLPGGGGGGGNPATVSQSPHALSDPAPAPEPEPAPETAKAEPAKEEPAPEIAKAEETPVPIPTLEQEKKEPEVKPKPEEKPKAEAKKEPKPEHRHFFQRRPKPERAPKNSLPPAQAVAAAAPAPATTEPNQGSGSGTGPGVGPGSGPGPAGPGNGKGPGQGPGPGGYGGDGPGGGGGGEYVGQFGRGDGPTFRSRTLPHYPSQAKRDNQEGKVVLRLFIDADGVLRNTEVMEHTGLEFVDEALRAIRASTFYPAKSHGHAVASRALLTIRFKMD